MGKDRVQEATAAAARSLQSCPTLCDPIDSSPPGTPVPGILQARTLEWGAISSSHAWKWKVKVKSLSRVRLPATPWTAAHQAPPSMGFSRLEDWRSHSKQENWETWANIIKPLHKNNNKMTNFRGLKNRLKKMTWKSQTVKQRNKKVIVEYNEIERKIFKRIKKTKTWFF